MDYPRCLLKPWASAKRAVLGFASRNRNVSFTLLLVGGGVLGLSAVRLSASNPAVALLATLLALLAYLRSFLEKCRPSRLVLGRGPLAQALPAIPSLHRGPRCPIWAVHPLSQLGPWMLQNLLHKRWPPRSEAHEFRVADRLSKEDADSPRTIVETLRAVLVPPREDSLPLEAPVVVFLPGLACDAQDLPGQHTLLYARSRGYRCAVLERRGQWRPLESARFNILGDAEDLEAGVQQLRHLLPDAPLFLAGTSAGSALLVSALGKFDARRRKGDTSAPAFVAAVDLFPGFDIAPGGCMVRSRPPFSSIMLESMRSHFVQRNAELLQAFDSEAYEAAMAAQDCDAFLAATAAFAGYPSGIEALDVAENPARFVEMITTPFLVILAADDPISVLENFTKTPRGSLHQDFHPSRQWKPAHRVTHEEFIPTTEVGAVCIASSGSHCPTLDGYVCPVRWESRCLASWSDEAMFDYFDFVSAHLGGRGACTDKRAITDS